MLLALPPVAPLAPYVAGYWFVQDLTGEHAGSPIRTTPYPGAILTINFGRPNAMVAGPIAPRASLLGLQTIGRQWRSWADTYFVMAMLTIEGLVRLFPGTGAGCRDALLDLGAVLGDGSARNLSRELAAMWRPRIVCARLDRWFLERLDDVRAPRELSRLAIAHELLRAGHGVGATAAFVDITRRQLDRWSQHHLGIGPKQLMDLERLQSSVRALQLRRGDPSEGFSDQSHQIRSWRRRLGETPRSYSRAAPSAIASYFGRSAPTAPALYL